MSSRRERLLTVAVLFFMSLFASGFIHAMLADDVGEWSGFALMFLLVFGIMGLGPLAVSMFIPTEPE